MLMLLMVHLLIHRRADRGRIGMLVMILVGQVEDLLLLLMLLLLLSDRVRIGHQLQVERFAVVNRFLVQLMSVLVVVAGTLAVVNRWRCSATMRRSYDSFLLQHDRWIWDLQEGRRRAGLEESGPTWKWLIRGGTTEKD